MQLNIYCIDSAICGPSVVLDSLPKPLEIKEHLVDFDSSLLFMYLFFRFAEEPRFQNIKNTIKRPNLGNCNPQ